MLLPNVLPNVFYVTYLKCFIWPHLAPPSAWPWTMLFRSLVVDLATDPLHTTSTGSTCVHQLRSSVIAAISVYFRLLRS